jgi:GNAT superfamily N-acetyltransferase
VILKVVCTLADYPPGLIGTVSALFGRHVSASHGVNWTLDAMIAEEQCEFFRRFDPERDRVWVPMEGAVPKGGLTIEGPRSHRESARLRFFILDESLRGQGIGRRMLAEAMQFCRDRHWRRIYLTTLSGLDAAMHLYAGQGFSLVSESRDAFHGSRAFEQTYESLLGDGG